MKYYIGTSGWSYPSFRGILYPEGMKSKGWLRFYSERFNTVEINATFYRTPRKSTFEKWYAETPKDFMFSIKAHKSITHIKRLKDVDEELKTFFKSIAPLKEKGRVILYQFPPSLTFNKEVLENFLAKLPSDYKHVVEVRNRSFHTEEFFELLKRREVCLCFSDFGGRYPSWVEVMTADFLYIRMHGRERVYFSNYSEDELFKLAQTIMRFKADEVFVYFDNTGLGYAVQNAMRLRELLKNSPSLKT